MRFSIILFSFLFVAACSTGINPYQFADENGTRESFTLCHGYSCTYRTPVGLNDKQWASVLKVFRKPAKTAEQEREKITRALAKIEKYTHQVSGLSLDKAEAASLPEDPGQMDCIDETVNTAQALKFLETEGVFEFHKIARPIHRGYFVDFMWPHNSAAIKEISSGQVYAVDSFFEDNGTKSHIVKKEDWMKNWSPRKNQEN